MTECLLYLIEVIFPQEIPKYDVTMYFIASDNHEKTLVVHFDIKRPKKIIC